MKHLREPMLSSEAGNEASFVPINVIWRKKREQAKAREDKGKEKTRRRKKKHSMSYDDQHKFQRLAPCSPRWALFVSIQKNIIIFMLYSEISFFSLLLCFNIHSHYIRRFLFVVRFLLALFFSLSSSFCFIRLEMYNQSPMRLKQICERRRLKKLKELKIRELIAFGALSGPSRRPGGGLLLWSGTTTGIQSINLFKFNIGTHISGERDGATLFSKSLDSNIVNWFRVAWSAKQKRRFHVIMVRSSAAL